ncbi:MAG TPA: hypothetical protein VJP58_02160 [Candidatus Nitrosocosmicus sp.]|nr:hypothetical protein [Candidatus Nitrosocosmicus sp.]
MMLVNGSHCKEMREAYQIAYSGAYLICDARIELQIVDTSTEWKENP